MKFLQAFCCFELVLLLIVTFVALPSVVAPGAASALYGGADDCYGTGDTKACSQLGNNGDGCSGNYYEVNVSSSGTFSKKTKEDKWCGGCDSEVTQFDLESGCY